MTNRFTAPPPDQIILAKLRVLLQKVNEVYSEGGFSLDDEITDVYNEAMKLFFDTIDGSIVGVTYPIIPGAPPDPVDYNVFTTAISRDLEAMFLEVGAVDRLVSSNFNTLIALKDHLLTVARRISLKTGDYLLYADPSLGNGFFFGDSFNSSRYLDIGSDLLDSDECLISHEEGVVLLPLDGKPERVNISKYIINNNSNGVSGNNQQIDIFPHNDINALGDGEPDSWFEYESVTQSAASSPLVFDLTIALQEPSIINHIHMNPVFFGTPSPVKIITLETSADGKDYTSVKGEVPISDFLSEEEDDVFVLSGKSGKYYGEGRFSFLPRRAQFVHIVLEQHTAYSIETNSGTLLRYAIGLKDINILSRKFKTEGEVVSTPINITGDATKISLWASENPTQQSVLANIRHEISVDDGSTWRAIQPIGRDEVVSPEILNFNNADMNSINTSTEIRTVRHRVVMSRDPDAFKGDVTIKSERKDAIEIVPIPGFSPINVTLQNEPIAETVSVYLPTLGSLSCPQPNNGWGTEGSSAPMDLDFVTFTIASMTTASSRFKLPWVNIPDLEHKIRVFINGEQWEYALKTKLSEIGPLSKVYYMNLNGREIQFVHVENDKNYGRPPGAGAKVEICLDGDNPSMTKTDIGYTLNLLGPSDGFKENTSIVTPTELLTEDVSETVGTWQEVHVPSSLVFNLNRHLRGENGVVYSNDSAMGKMGHYFLKRTTKSVEPKEEAESPIDETSLGMLPPMYGDTHSTHFKLVEYLQTGTIPIPEGDTDRAYRKDAGDPDSHVANDGYVPYINGSDEFLDTNGDLQTRRWTFDSYSGNLFFASHPIRTQRTIVNGILTSALPSDNRIVFKFRRRLFKVLDESEWNYYKNTVTGKTDTSRVVVEPTAVRQFEITVPITTDIGTGAVSKRLFLLEDIHEDLTQQGIQLRRYHSFWKKRIVRSSIKFANPNTILSGIQPVEVSFINGKSELQNTRQTKYNISAQTGAGIKTFTFPNIDTDRPLVEDILFDPIPVYPDPIHVSQFLNRVDEIVDIVTDGDYHIGDTTGVVNVKIPTGSNLKPHMAIYRFEDLTSGIIKEGLFSVDYDEGVIYFSEDATILEDTVTFNVTMYSAFYNLGEVVSNNNIEKIDEGNKTVELKASYGTRFLKDSASNNPVPRFLRVGYEYYESSTESLKDLEPYFSPISKDLAIRAITKDMIGDI